MNNLPASKSPRRQFRTEALASKFRALSDEQRASLVSWLGTEKVTLAVASERLLTQFHVSLSISAVSRFWQRHCRPQPTAPASSDVLLDVVIQSARPVRVIVKQKAGGIQLTKKSEC